MTVLQNGSFKGPKKKKGFLKKSSSSDICVSWDHNTFKNWWKGNRTHCSIPTPHSLQILWQCLVGLTDGLNASCCILLVRVCSLWCCEMPARLGKGEQELGRQRFGDRSTGMRWSCTHFLGNLYKTGQGLTSFKYRGAGVSKIPLPSWFTAEWVAKIESAR